MTDQDKIRVEKKTAKKQVESGNRSNSLINIIQKRKRPSIL